MPRIYQRAQIAVKKETTYGTDAVPVAADVILVKEVKFEVVTNPLDRDILDASLSRFDHVLGLTYAKLNFKTELKGSGTAGTAPEWGPLIQACSFTETIVPIISVTYIPNSDVNPASCTIYFNADGMRHRMTGCRGTFKLSAKANNYAEMEFEIWGLFNSVTDTSPILLPVVDSTLPVVSKGCGFTIGGYDPVTSNLEIDIANQLYVFEDLNATTGINSIRITGRKPKGKLEVEAVLEATENYWADWEANLHKTIDLAWNGGAGNIVTLTGHAQHVKIDYKNDNGVLKYDMELNIPRSSASVGDSEFTIALT